MIAHEYDYSDVAPVSRVPEAAEILKASERFTRDLIQSGELGSIRLGRLIRVPRHAILKILGANGSDPTETGEAANTTPNVEERGRRGAG